MFEVLFIGVILQGIESFLEKCRHQVLDGDVICPLLCPSEIIDAFITCSIEDLLIPVNRANRGPGNRGFN